MAGGNDVLQGVSGGRIAVVISDDNHFVQDMPPAAKGEKSEKPPCAELLVQSPAGSLVDGQVVNNQAPGRLPDGTLCPSDWQAYIHLAPDLLYSRGKGLALEPDSVGAVAKDLRFPTKRTNETVCTVVSRTEAAEKRQCVTPFKDGFDVDVYESEVRAERFCSKDDCYDVERLPRIRTRSRVVLNEDQVPLKYRFVPNLQVKTDFVVRQRSMAGAGYEADQGVRVSAVLPGVNVSLRPGASRQLTWQTLAGNTWHESGRAGGQPYLAASFLQDGTKEIEFGVDLWIGHGLGKIANGWNRNALVGHLVFSGMWDADPNHKGSNAGKFVMGGALEWKPPLWRGALGLVAGAYGCPRSDDACGVYVHTGVSMNFPLRGGI